MTNAYKHGVIRRANKCPDAHMPMKVGDKLECEPCDDDATGCKFTTEGDVNSLVECTGCKEGYELDPKTNTCTAICFANTYPVVNGEKIDCKACNEACNECRGHSIKDCKECA